MDCPERFWSTLILENRIWKTEFGIIYAMNTIHKAIHKLHNPDLGILFLRVAVGIVFIHAGWGKVTDVASVAGFFGGIGIPAWLAYVVAYTEFIGGMLLVGGLFVRYAGILLAIIMLVATFKVHWANGFGLAKGGYEYTFLLFFLCLTIITSGAGKYSIAGLLKK